MLLRSQDRQCAQKRCGFRNEMVGRERLHLVADNAIIQGFPRHKPDDPTTLFFLHAGQIEVPLSQQTRDLCRWRTRGTGLKWLQNCARGNPRLYQGAKFGKTRALSSVPSDG